MCTPTCAHRGGPLENELVSLCLQNIVASSAAWRCSLPRPPASKTAIAGQLMSLSFLRLVQLAICQADPQRVQWPRVQDKRLHRCHLLFLSLFSELYRDIPANSNIPQTCPGTLDKIIRCCFHLYRCLYKKA